jgi:hypothetical protein
MRPFRQILAAVAPLSLLAACVSAGGAPIIVDQRPSPTGAKPPAVRIPPSDPVAPSSGFIPPQILRGAGLENVIGASAAQLERRFGKARLDIEEGDARKLQFAGEPCVLDIFLYPLRPGEAPVATHVEARRASDGRDVDRAACVRALGSK